jgi:Tfp pilus tip-associated adhesin PilY1
MVTRQWSDDELFAALKQALRAAQNVPKEFIEAGKAAYAWHNIDAELAALTYDSAVSVGAGTAVTRSEPATLRALTFAASQLTLELEVTGDALRGQLVPPQAGTIEVRTAAGPVADAAVDEVGYFVIRPVPSGSFRLSCRTTSGITILTGWIAL